MRDMTSPGPDRPLPERAPPAWVAPGPAPPEPVTTSRRIAGWAGTTIAVTLAFIGTLLDATFATDGMPDMDSAVLWWLVWVLVGGGAAVALAWRIQHAFVVCLVSASLFAVFPVGPIGAMCALVWVYITQRWRNVAIATAAVAAALSIGAWRDHARGVDALFVFVDEVSGETVQMNPVGYVALVVLGLGLTVAIGMARRYRASARAARRAERAHQRAAHQLRTELSRQEERDLIAREMHDTVAHHLSLVSLHASALEVTAADPGTDVPGAARSMRSAAHRALEEMRSLISTLRDSAASDHLGAGAPTLDDLPGLVDDARSAGADITPMIMVSGAESAPPALTRAVYRIVQEGLTNAVKHAPTAPVQLDLRAAPGRGVQVTVANRLLSSGPGRPGSWGGAPGRDGSAETALGLPGDEPGPAPGSSGSGLRGIAERVHMLGGTFQAGVDGDTYLLHAELPWVASTSG